MLAVFPAAFLALSAAQLPAAGAAVCDATKLVGSWTGSWWRKAGQHPAATSVYSFTAVNVTHFAVTSKSAHVGWEKGGAFGALDADFATEAAALITRTRKAKDSLGSAVEIVAVNVPSLLGDPLYQSLKMRLMGSLGGLHAVQACEIGAGSDVAERLGSDNNDSIRRDGYTSNSHGGLIGGITTGKPLVCRVSFKPTSTIALAQESVRKDLQEIDFIRDNYAKAENVSIDYAIMEKSENVHVIPATFDWNDLGTWGSLYDKLDKDENDNAVVNSKTLLEDASGNMIRSKKGKVVVVEGLKDYIIVDKDEVLLIFPKAKEQDIKKVLQNVKRSHSCVKVLELD